MRPQKVLDNEILAGLTKVFRSKGYEGASLKDLSDATGLKKASLYHRFPNGKKEMAEAVFTYINTWVIEHIFEALNDETISPKKRLKNALNQISALYDGGKKTCIFRAFSMESSLELFEKQVKSGMDEWIKNFKKIGIALDLSEEIASAYALQTLIEVQGSLVVSKGINNIDIFKETLQKIENQYLQT